jgi:hypothetical protein
LMHSWGESPHDTVSPEEKSESIRRTSTESGSGQ